MPIWFKALFTAVWLGAAYLLSLFPLSHRIAAYAGSLLVSAQGCALLGFGIESLIRKTGVLGAGDTSTAGVLIGTLLGLGVGFTIAPWVVQTPWAYWTISAIGALFVLSWFTAVNF